MGQGHSIVYCDKCGLLLREDDFLKGKASTVDNRSFCALCRPVEAPPPEPVPHSSGSSGRLKAIPGSSKISSTRLKMPSSDSYRIPAAPPPPPAKSSAPLVIGGVLAAVALIGVVIAFSSGGSGRPSGAPAEPPAPEPPRLTLPKPEPVKPVTPPSPVSPAREEAGRTAYKKALDLQQSRPQDLAAQVRAFQEVVSTMGDTPFAEQATQKLVAVKRQLFEKLSAVEDEARKPISQEQFKAALDIWDAARSKYDLPEWNQAVDQRLTDIKALAKGRFVQARDAALHAKRAGAQDPIKAQKARVAKWGLPEYVVEFDKALVEVTVDAEESPAPAPAASKALDTYRARWKAALAPVPGRDLTDVVKAVSAAAAGLDDPEVKKEAAADLENITLIAALLKEALPLLPKLAKGQKAALSYWDAAGNPSRVEDEVLRIDAHRVEIKQGEFSVVIPLGEIAPVTVAELFRARAAKKPEDGRVAALFCLLEGDLEGARKVQGEPAPELPDRYLAYARELPKASAAEKAARELFYDAELSYFIPAELTEAVRKYKLLLADHGATAFVRRNRAAIAARTEGGKEYLFLPGDFLVSPTFKTGKFGRIEGVRVSTQDLELSAIRDNSIDIDFAAQPDTEYRCWVYAGGCCLEVFGFYYQASELTGPDPQNPKEKISLEPGAASGLPAKLPYLSLKKLHSQHTGPKEPDRFEWIPIALPKFTTPGAKKVRLLTHQKGFGIAYACVSSTRQGPPRDLDLREQEKLRAETPGFISAIGGVATGSILREVWKAINGTGIGDLTGNGDFKADKPGESGQITVFDCPMDAGDNYGTRVRGYVHPPVSGNYIFWIASDDQGELFLSTDEDPARKVKIASVQDHTSPKVFDKYPAQKSQPIPLRAGRRYYIEALQKEGGGGDHLTVGWQLPAGAREIPIPGSRLSPFVPVRK